MARRIVRPPRIGEGREMPETDNGPLAGLRKFIPSIETGIRCVREKQKAKERAFEPTAATILGREAAALERLIFHINRGRL